MLLEPMVIDDAVNENGLRDYIILNENGLRDPFSFAAWDSIRCISR